MDKAVIVGVFEFLGLHLCKRFLEEGIEVEGIHVDYDEDCFFLEEKRMEIGRNANFTEKSFQNWELRLNKNDEVVVLVDYYDFFIMTKENLICESDQLNRIYSISDNKPVKIILLLPIQLLADNHFEQSHLQLRKKFDIIRKREAPFQAFYLPTIYGPWQPSEFIFQQSFLKGNKELKDLSISEREWILDALYVKETVDVIFQCLQEDHEEYILKSDESGQWDRCAQFLSIPLKEKNVNLASFPDEVVEKVIKPSTPFQKGLEKQKRHTDGLIDVENFF